MAHKHEQFIGDSTRLGIPLKWQGRPFTPGTEWDLIWSLKADVDSDEDADALLQKETGIGITHSGDDAIIELVPQDTAGDADADPVIPAIAPGTYYWGILAIRISDGARRTVATGSLILNQAPTREIEPSIPIHTTAPPSPYNVAGQIALANALDPIVGTEKLGAESGGSLFSIALDNLKTWILDGVSSAWDSLTGTVSVIPFNTANGAPANVGEMAWDVEEGAPSYAVPNGHSALNKEIWDYYTNMSGTTMVDGDIVSIVGVSGNRSAVDLTDATSFDSAKACIGMVTNGAADNQTVRVTKIGTVHALDTAGMTEGGQVFVDPANPGKWTQTEPSYPDIPVRIGYVQVANANVGIVDVAVWADGYSPTGHTHVSADITDSTADGNANPGKLLRTSSFDLDGTPTDGWLTLNKVTATSGEVVLGSGADQHTLYCIASGITGCEFPARDGTVAYLDDIPTVGTGATDVAAGNHGHALSSLEQSGASINQVATWNGSEWVPANASGAVDNNSVNTAIAENNLATRVALGGAEPMLGAQIIGGALSANAAASISAGGVVSIAVAAPGFGGYGYPTPPTVTITGGGGTGATATAILTNSVVTGFTITNAGSGYSSAPTVALSAIPTGSSRTLFDLNYEVVLIADSYARIGSLGAGDVRPLKGLGQENPYNLLSGAAFDASYAHTTTSKAVRLPSGASADYSYNGNPGPMYGVRVVYLIQPGGGTLTVQRKVGAGAFTTIHTVSTDGALGAAAFTQDFFTPTGGFGYWSTGSDNTIRVLSSGAEVKVLSVATDRAKHGFRFTDLSSNSGTDWAVQLASLNTTTFVEHIKSLNAKMLVYSYADSVLEPKWANDVYPALRAACPNMQIVVIGGHPIKTTRPEWAYNDQAIKDARTWCAANRLPLLDVQSVIPTWEGGVESGMFSVADEVHTTDRANRVITAAFLKSPFWTWTGNNPAVKFNDTDDPGQELGSLLGITGTSASEANAGRVRWYNFPKIPSEYFQAHYFGNRFTLRKDGSGLGMVLDTNTNQMKLVPTSASADTATFTLGSTALPWGSAHINNITFPTGANTKIGTGAVIGSSGPGFVTIANTSVGANSHIIITKTAHGAGVGGASYVVTKINATSFTITAVDTSGATVTTDTSTFDWVIVERR